MQEVLEYVEGYRIQHALSTLISALRVQDFLLDVQQLALKSDNVGASEVIAIAQSRLPETAGARGVFSKEQLMELIADLKSAIEVAESMKVTPAAV